MNLTPVNFEAPDPAPPTRTPGSAAAGAAVTEPLAGTGRIRLLCDQMLGGLGRWLRAAGHDAAAAEPGRSKSELIELARTEDRVLLTRDRALVRDAKGHARALLVASEDVEAQALTLATDLGLDWTLAPFTRCLVDNAPLREASEAEISRMPEPTRALPGPFRACPDCGRLYWPGSHVRRMSLKLEQWRRQSRTKDDSAGGAGGQA